MKDARLENHSHFEFTTIKILSILFSERKVSKHIHFLLGFRVRRLVNLTTTVDYCLFKFYSLVMLARLIFSTAACLAISWSLIDGTCLTENKEDDDACTTVCGDTYVSCFNANCSGFVNNKTRELECEKKCNDAHTACIGVCADQFIWPCLFACYDELAENSTEFATALHICQCFGGEYQCCQPTMCAVKFEYNSTFSKEAFDAARQECESHDCTSVQYD